MRKIEQKFRDLRFAYAETFNMRLMGDDPLVNI